MTALLFSQQGAGNRSRNLPAAGVVLSGHSETFLLLARCFPGAPKPSCHQQGAGNCSRNACCLLI